MESELSADKENNTPPHPLNTYLWEDLRRARDAGGYPWTHLLKAPLEGEITAEDILRDTTPKRSMSREFSRSRTRSPAGRDEQKILDLDSSPGSSRKHGEDGQDEGVHIPTFSKEVSLDCEDDPIKPPVENRPESSASLHLATSIEIPKNVSPKGILKRRVPEQQYVAVTETREKTKCCHPLVNKIKHLADKTLHKFERSENEKSPLSKRKKNEQIQEIKQLKSSPGAVRRQKFSAIKLGDSDEMSKTMSIETPPPRKKKEHIYEDIDEKQETDKTLHFSPDVENLSERDQVDDRNNNKENESISEKKSIASQDPSLVTDETNSLKQEDHIMEKLHKTADVSNEATLLDEEMEAEEPNVDEIFQNQLDESLPKNDSPNITITEILDEDSDQNIELSNTIPIETSPSPSPRALSRKSNEVNNDSSEWSKPNSDHEYEIIEKPPPSIVYNAPRVDEKQNMVKTDEELSSTTSIERKYLQHTYDEDEHMDDMGNIHDENNDNDMSAEAFQKNIEDRFFVNTPSTVSRTECEVSTSQVDSSALENLPLKRENRTKNAESLDNKIQQRIKEGTGKLKTQAGKLKTKLQNIKTKQFTMPDRPKINLPDRPKFKMPDRPKFSFPDRSKFTLPDRRKFSLPDRPKFKKINISEKLHLGDHKFTLPERPKFNVPDLSKFKLPDRPKINFPSLSRKKENREDTTTSGSTTDLRNVASVEFEARTYPRLFGRKKKSELPKTSSSPTLNREDTPPPTFTFTRTKKPKERPMPFISDSPDQPREYGNVDTENNYAGEENRNTFETTYDFDKLDSEYIEDIEPTNMNNGPDTASSPDISPNKQEYTHINEINNDEFFVRPRGISRENIQVREYLSDEIRQAFKIPKNVLALMGSNAGVNDDNIYVNEPEADPELMLDDNEPLGYSTEDLNDKDDGYYTFPPVRPSRAKRKNKEAEGIRYIDDSVTASMQFSEVDLGLPQTENIRTTEDNLSIQNEENHFIPTDLRSIHEYANDDVIEYPDNVMIQSQTLPMPPKRKKKSDSKDIIITHTSLRDLNSDLVQTTGMWEPPGTQIDDVIVYRTEHEYIVPQTETIVTTIEQSPVAPRRTRSRSSRGTSFCDDDRTSHGAESLTLDTHLTQADVVDIERDMRRESPGYAVVDKGSYAANKSVRRSSSKTPPPIRRRKSNSSERKYYTVGPTKPIPDRPPRKKSSTSMMTLDNFSKRSVSADLTQYVEIDEPQIEESHKDLQSGEVVSKMKDRPLPPPPRPPRGSRKEKKSRSKPEKDSMFTDEFQGETENRIQDTTNGEDVVEIEVSTQTDPLPDDVDFELGLEENLDVSMSSDIIDDESGLFKNHRRATESPRFSRPSSRSEKSIKLSDPKISELSKSTSIGRTSPTVILVERRVSSPTRINERDEMLTEASLTVQHIDIDESQIPEVPPLPKSKGKTTESRPSKNIVTSNEDRALEKISDASRDVILDNLVTQRLQVRDLDVGRLNVSELQASKILVSDIEGMTLQVTELDSKSGHISVSGIEFSQTVIDEIVKKFAEITTSQATTVHVHEVADQSRPISREEHTQTDVVTESKPEVTSHDHAEDNEWPIENETAQTSASQPSGNDRPPRPPPPQPRPSFAEECVVPPQRPPPPDLTPLLYSYLQDIAMTPSSFYPMRTARERPPSDVIDSHQSPPPPTRRAKRKPAAPHSESSSDDSRPRPSPRKMPPPVRAHEPTITEAGAQFLRVCQSSISRTLRSMFNSFMSYINGTEDKKDMQMALVIFLVLIAGLIMFGLSDSRTIHHHHWEFFNPPDSKQ